MSDYRRLYVPGGTYFFTLVTYERQNLFAEAFRVEQLRQSLRVVKKKRPFTMVAAVVLPDHLHCIWRLPEGDADFSTRWQMIKTDFSRHVPGKTRKGDDAARAARVVARSSSYLASGGANVKCRLPRPAHSTWVLLTRYQPSNAGASMARLSGWWRPVGSIKATAT